MKKSKIKSITLEKQDRVYCVIKGSLVREVGSSWFCIDSIWNSPEDAQKALIELMSEEDVGMDVCVQALPLNTKDPFREMIENEVNINSEDYYNSEEYHESSCW